MTERPWYRHIWLWIMLAWIKRELCVLSGLTGC